MMDRIIKYLVECSITSDGFHDLSGIGTESVNELEREFLRAIDWNLLARSKEFEAKMEQLERSVALRKGKERLWKLSYTDLWVFLSKFFGILWLRMVMKHVYCLDRKSCVTVWAWKSNCLNLKVRFYLAYDDSIASVFS